MLPRRSGSETTSCRHGTIVSRNPFRSASSACWSHTSRSSGSTGKGYNRGLLPSKSSRAPSITNAKARPRRAAAVCARSRTGNRVGSRSGSSTSSVAIRTVKGWRRSWPSVARSCVVETPVYLCLAFALARLQHAKCSLKVLQPLLQQSDLIRFPSLPQDPAFSHCLCAAWPDAVNWPEQVLVGRHRIARLVRRPLTALDLLCELVQSKRVARPHPLKIRIGLFHRHLSGAARILAQFRWSRPGHRAPHHMSGSARNLPPLRGSVSL